MNRMPAAFLGHGSPMEAIERDAYTDAVASFGRALGRPDAIVVASAHWAAPGPLRVSGAERPETIHDFFGFPDALHEMTYPAPGDPALAKDIASRLNAAGLPAAVDPRRGLDHGTWVPLSRLRPEADVPVIQISVPVPSAPDVLRRAGAALAPLREAGVLLLGSGNVTHNLRRAAFGDKTAAVPAWAAAFDAWAWERLSSGQTDDLVAYRRLGPHADLAVPDPDHFDPVLFAAGGAADERTEKSGPGSGSGRPALIYDGFHYGNISMRSWHW